MNKKPAVWVLWVLGLCVVLAAVSFCSLIVGPMHISLKSTLSSLLAGERTTELSVLLDIRLPRIVLGFAVGGALSLAGVMLQGMFRNPLVEPYTLGISGGAAVGVCLNIIFRLNQTAGILSVPVCGFLGAILIVLLVYALSVQKGALITQRLLLTGVMLSFIASSLVMLLMSVSRAEDLHGIVFWIMGSLEEPSWVLIRWMCIVSLAGLVVSYPFCLSLNAFSLGEEQALHLGINPERTKRILFVLVSLLTGLCVSVAGIIGFVGLIVPHFLRMFVGGDHRILLISSYLAGAAFLIFCDTLARTMIAPVELPVGVITGILGGALFVYALTRRQMLFGVR